MFNSIGAVLPYNLGSGRACGPEILMNGAMSDTLKRLLGALILLATMGMSTVGALWNVRADAYDPAGQTEAR